MKVSIITVTYNAEKYIRECVKSILSQDYSDIELIIVDGKSEDSTINILNGYKNNFAHFISEKDNGMYDALNKGIDLATGDIVGILNSDDLLASSDVISSVVQKFVETGADILYGDLWYIDKDNENNVLRKWRSKPYSYGMFQMGWMPAHPTFYAKRQLFRKYGNYRLDLGSACDYELMLRFMHKYCVSSVYLPKLMVKMRAGGMSNSSMENRLKANKADLEAMRINGIKFPRLAAFLKPLRKIPQFLGR